MRGVELADRGPGRVEADIIWEDEPAEPGVDEDPAAAARGDSAETGDSPARWRTAEGVAGGQPRNAAARPDPSRPIGTRTGARRGTRPQRGPGD